ncbi:MAG: hypothetical protein P4L99_17990 [Chthoniobacter sp.]|nr:hypothetical protein [Chthoniobacter sp.]
MKPLLLLSLSTISAGFALPTLRTLAPSNNANTQAIVDSFKNILHAGDQTAPAPGTSDAPAAPGDNSTASTNSDPVPGIDSSMQADDLRRKFGEPQRVAEVTGGGQTWYYPTYIVYVVHNHVVYSRITNRGILSNAAHLIRREISSAMAMHTNPLVRHEERHEGPSMGGERHEGPSIGERERHDVPPMGYAFVPRTNSLGLNSGLPMHTSYGYNPYAFVPHTNSLGLNPTIPEHSDYAFVPHTNSLGLIPGGVPSHTGPGQVFVPHVNSLGLNGGPAGGVVGGVHVVNNSGGGVPHAGPVGGVPHAAPVVVHVAPRVSAPPAPVTNH